MPAKYLIQRLKLGGRTLNIVGNLRQWLWYLVSFYEVVIFAGLQVSVSLVQIWRLRIVRTLKSSNNRISNHIRAIHIYLLLK